MGSGLFVLKTFDGDKFFTSETDCEVMHKIIKESFVKTKNPFNSEIMLMSNLIENMFCHDFFWVLPNAKNKKYDRIITIDFKNRTITTSIGMTDFNTFIEADH